MPDFFWRVIWAALIAVFLTALLPIVFRLVGFPLDGDLLRVLRICGAAILTWYVIFGPRVI